MGKAASIPVAIASVMLVALGVACVGSDVAGERSAAARIAVPSVRSIAGSSSPTPTSPSETGQVPVEASTGAAFVDVRTGDAMPLPPRLTSWPDAARFQISPDGSMFSFEADWQIYVANVDGTGIRRLTRGDELRHSPAWSPDGTRLVYVGLDEPRIRVDDDLYVVDVASGDPARVTGVTGELWSPSFTPDGAAILFTKAGRYRLNLWTVPAAGGVPTMVLKDAAHGAYSPDGASIAFHETGSAAWPAMVWRINPSVWIANADGSEQRRIAGTSGQIASTAGWAWTLPRWSPDGTRIAYQDSESEQPGQIVVAWTHGRLRSMEVGTGSWPSWLDDHTLIVHETGGAG